jgi:hypothetical protein
MIGWRPIPIDVFYNTRELLDQASQEELSTPYVLLAQRIEYTQALLFKDLKDMSSLPTALECT